MTTNPQQQELNMELGILNTFLFLLCATLCSTSSDFCVRHIKYHYVSRDDYSLGYLSKLYSITDTLLQEGAISKASADIMKRTLTFSSHTLCEPGKEDTREKRQVVTGIIGLISGLVLPYVFQALIYPSGSASEINRFRSFAMKTRGMARMNEHKIYNLEQRVNRLQRKEDLNSLFDNTMQSLQLEEMKFSELMNNGPKFSTTLYNMLKPAIMRYKKLNIVDPSGRHSLNKSPLIPEAAIHVNVSTFANKDCGSAFVNISVYTPIPSSDCEKIHTMYESFIVTKIDNTNDCRVMAPLRALVLLPDKKSYLALANYFIAPDCNLDLFKFNFSDNLRTLFAVPIHKGGIVATCGGAVHRDLIEAAVGVVPSATCSSYISSGHINPSVKDIFQPGTWLLNSQGEFLDASTVPAMDFSFMDTATTTPASTTTSSTVSPDFDNLEPYVPSNLLWATTGTVLLLLIVVLGTVVLWRRGVFNKRAEYKPGKRLKIDDIEVISRTQLDNERALGRLHQIGNDLEAASKPEYRVQLLSMKSLNANVDSISKSSSFTDSTMPEYETPNEIKPTEMI